MPIIILKAVLSAFNFYASGIDAIGKWIKSAMVPIGIYLAGRKSGVAAQQAADRAALDRARAAEDRSQETPNSPDDIIRRDEEGTS